MLYVVVLLSISAVLPHLALLNDASPQIFVFGKMLQLGLISAFLEEKNAIVQ